MSDEVGKVELSDEMIEELRALGYTD